jgi:hypothetical protein
MRGSRRRFGGRRCSRPRRRSARREQKAGSSRESFCNHRSETANGQAACRIRLAFSRNSRLRTVEDGAPRVRPREPSHPRAGRQRGSSRSIPRILAVDPAHGAKGGRRWRIDVWHGYSLVRHSSSSDAAATATLVAPAATREPADPKPGARAELREAAQAALARHLPGAAPAMAPMGECPTAETTAATPRRHARRPARARSIAR